MMSVGPVMMTYWNPTTNQLETGDQFMTQYNDPNPYAPWKSSSSYSSSHHSQQPYHMTAKSSRRARPAGNPQNIVIPRSPGQAISHIPAELWIKLFCFALGSYRGEGATCFRPSPRSAPMKLTQICRGLRMIAQSAKELWATICISPSYSGNFPHRRLIRQWVELSRKTPLTIIFKDAYSIRPPGGELLNATFREVLRYIDQWGTVVLWGPWTDYAYNLPLPSRPSMLKSVVLEGSVNVAHVGPFVTQLIANAPLTSFEWEDKIPHAREHKPGFFEKLPLSSGLTRLNITNSITVTEMLHVLSHLPSLQECSTQNVFIPQGTFTQDPINYIVILSHLRTLKMKVDSTYVRAQIERGSVMCSLLNGLTTPALQNLSLRDDWAPWAPKIFRAFMQRSQCQLDSLEFAVVSITDQDLIASLKQCVHLRNLTIITSDRVRSPISLSVLQQMAPNPSSAYYLVPSLRSITVNGPTLRDCGDYFAQMVYARCGIPQRRGRLQVNIIVPPNMQHYLARFDQLKQLHRSGSIRLNVIHSA